MLKRIIIEKLDLTKKYKSYFTAKLKPELIDIETAHYLSITGKGDPSDTTFSFHHEIYLSDFNKTALERLKTILREPIK